jgi:hypothetical protein
MRSTQIFLDSPDCAWYRHGTRRRLSHATYNPVVRVLMFMASNVQGQSKPVCSLLTATDVSAVGATGEGIPGEMPMGNGAKAGTMKMCSWRMKAGGLHLSANPTPVGASRAAIEAQLTSTYQKLTSKGWKQEKKDFGDVSCTLFIPPAGEKSAPASTSCLTFVKGMLVNADTISVTPISMEKLKPLVDSASGRL